jgi:hypothetical protein
MKKKIILAVLALGISTNVFARGTSSALLIDPFFSMGALGIGGSSDLNDKIDDISAFIPDAAGPKFSKSFGVMIGYRFKHRYNIGLIFDYTSAGTFFSREETTPFSIYNGTTTARSARYYEFNGGFSGTAIGPALYYTVYNGGKLTFDVGLGILYAFKINYFDDSTWSATSSSDTTGLTNNLRSVSGSGKGFGFLLGTSTSYYFTNYLGLSFDLAYKYLKAGSISDADGNEINFTWADGTTDPTPAPLSVNLSGLYFGLSLKIEFDIGAGGSAPTEAKAAEEGYAPETAAQSQEMTAGWEDTPVAAPMTEAGPTIEELRDVKKQVQRKWNDLRSDTSADAQKKADRYRRLYDVVTKFEKDWDQFSPQSRAGKMDKIRLILTR